MANRQNVIIGIKFTPQAQVKSELNTIIAYLNQNSKIDLQFDTKKVTQSLNEFSKTLDNISSKITQSFNGKGVTDTTEKIKNATKANKEFQQSLGIAGVTKGYEQLKARAEDLKNTMQSLSKVNVKSDSSGNIESAILTYKDNLGNTINETMAWKNKTNEAGEVVSSVFKTVGVSATENIAKVEKINAKLEATKNAMQGKLNSATQLNSMNSNSFIDPSVLTNLQNKLNGINTNTAEKEIKDLQTVINNLGSSNSGIVKVQSAITKMEDGLKTMKGKYGSLVGDSNSITQLRTYESEIGKLKTLLASLKNGDTISPIAITNATTQATTANRNLSTAIQTSSRAMRTGQQDAISFGDSMKKAFQNAGIYMSTYMVIQKVFREIKEGIQTVIEMDTALADLNKVVNLSKSQLDDMKESAISLGKELGQSATDVAQAMAEFGRLYKDTASIKEMTKVSVLGSNVMDNTSSAQVAKSLTTIMTAMKKEVGDSMGILDSMNEIKCVSPYIVIYK